MCVCFEFTLFLSGWWIKMGSNQRIVNTKISWTHAITDLLGTIMYTYHTSKMHAISYHIGPRYNGTAALFTKPVYVYRVIARADHRVNAFNGNVLRHKKIQWRRISIMASQITINSTVFFFNSLFKRTTKNISKYALLDTVSKIPHKRAGKSEIITSWSHLAAWRFYVSSSIPHTNGLPVLLHYTFIISKCLDWKDSIQKFICRLMSRTLRWWDRNTLSENHNWK